MQISSPTFETNQLIPIKYTGLGENINPPLIFEDVPENAQSLALIMDDPDAPGGIWIHWILWNINPKEKGISENSVPNGAIQGSTNRENKYSGPNPPSGTHRYFFKLYALDKKLDLLSTSNKQELEKAMAGHILVQAQLIGLYQSKNN